MSSAASEGSFTVKAPSITAPPCGLSLHQQPGNLSVAQEVPWVRITLSQSYFIHCFLTVLLISLFHTHRASLSPSFLPLRTSFFSRSPTALPSQADWLSSSRLLHHTGHFQFFSFSFKEPPPVFPFVFLPTLLPPQSPTPHACLSGGLGRGGLRRRRGQSKKIKMKANKHRHK